MSGFIFAVEELHICLLNINVYCGAIVVSSGRYFNISKCFKNTFPKPSQKPILPNWHFSFSPYTLRFAGRIESQIFWTHLGTGKPPYLPPKLTPTLTKLPIYQTYGLNKIYITQILQSDVFIVSLRKDIKSLSKS